ncbi:unnamed protein product, partial [Phaeothamnion confervicola]
GRGGGGSGGGGGGGGGERFKPGQHPLEGVPGVDELPTPEALSSRVDLSEVGGLNALLGDYVTRCLYSKAWVLREAAVLKIRLRLPALAALPSSAVASSPSAGGGTGPGLDQALPQLAQVLRLGAEDKIAQVFLTAGALLGDVLDAATADRTVRHNTLVSQLEPVVATLLLKLGDGQTRVRDGAMDGLVAVARCRTAGPGFVGHLAAKTMPRKQATAWRPVYARLQLLTALVREFGLSAGSGGGSSGLGADAVMAFVKDCGAFAHSNGQVRDAAKDLTVAVYKAVGDDVERHLGELRPKQLEEYRQAFKEAGAPLVTSFAAAATAAPGGGATSRRRQSAGGSVGSSGGGG